MGSCVPWDFEDETGDNPTGQAGVFLFDVWYEIEFEPARRYDADGDGDPGYGPAIEIVGVTCKALNLDGRGYRRLAHDEAVEIGQWFHSYLDSHPDEHARVEETALQYMHISRDDDARW